MRRWLSVILIFTLVGVVVWSFRGGRTEVVEVELVQVAERAVFKSFVSASGEIVATRFADVGSSVMGKVVSLRVREGDRVRAGQTLAQIDPVQASSDRDAAAAQIGVLEAERAAAQDQLAVLRADLDAAMARATEAARQEERLDALAQSGLVPKADRETAVAAADAAKAQVASLRAGLARAEQSLSAAQLRVTQAKALARRADDVLAKTEITAPMDGVISRLKVREGEMVVVGIQNQPGTTLMTISDLSAIDAEVKVAEAEVLRLKIGQPATVTLEALPNVSFSGRVAEIGASALPVQGTGAAAREFRVIVRLDEGTQLLPGMTCDAEILAEERQRALVVPLQTVVLRSIAGKGETTGVFLMQGERAVFTPVTTGIIGGLEIEVTGVAAGATIVAGPVQVLRTLQDGDAVKQNPNPS